MFFNILHKKKEKEEKKYLNVKIYCIVHEFSDTNDDVIKSLRSYCLQKDLLFETRKYNSYKYSNDRNYIRSLPAFHLYINNNYNRTFYPNTRPFQHINEGLQIYLDKIERTKKKKEEWNKYLDTIGFSIRRLFGLTSLMERNRNNVKNNNK